jgi:hypothetical protein
VLHKIIRFYTDMKDQNNTYSFSSLALNSTRVLSGETRAPRTENVLRKTLLSMASLGPVYGGGEASRYKWRDMVKTKVGGLLANSVRARSMQEDAENKCSAERP